MHVKRIALVGATGRMGKCIIEQTEQHSKWRVAKKITRDLNEHDPWDHTSGHKIDVIIDFSNAAMTAELAKQAIGTKIPLLICTTGLSSATINTLKKCSEHAAVLLVSNTSIGIQLMHELLKIASSMLDSTFDVDIVETHHRHKVDAPSGTAFSLAKTIDAIRSISTKIHSLRSGEGFTEHTVTFNGNNETITLSHTAHSRDVFANGALRLADWLIEQKPGFYTSQDMLPV
ncbi:MAG: dihydrodipicolinate reductase C-terminal domain-containing protein [Candidatus Paracaedibacteraceae bacterium]|nr:dihydrodipicolinate reductase C-terminal domain-containing protein [Candidatus Paracaedibacteraceae bacterium]